MLGITYHNPATITVFLDRMRFKDCFLSQAELRDEQWRRKLKQFMDLPSDGRERVVFVESLAVLQALVQNGATFDGVKVAVYDDCSVLSRVPGTSIVDAHVNDEDETWKLYTLGFTEFNDALASQPPGIPALQDRRVEPDVPEPPEPNVPDVEVEEEEEEAPTPRSRLVMEEILGKIEDGEEEEEEPVYDVPDRVPEAAAVAQPERARGNVVIKKRRPGEPMDVNPATANEIRETVGVTAEDAQEAREILQTVPKPKAKVERKAGKRKAEFESYRLF